MSTKQKTQITFVSNKKLKDRTIRKAKEDGITLKALLTMAMKAYLDGDLSVSLRPRKKYDEIFSDKDIIEKSNELGALLKKTKI